MSTYLDSLKARIARDCVAIDREARFDEVMNESYSFASVGGPFAGLRPAEVLKKCDAVAYRTCVNDFASREHWTEVDGEWYEARAVKGIADTFVSVLEGRISEIGEAVEQMGDPLERIAAEETLAELRAAIGEVRRHVF